MSYRVLITGSRNFKNVDFVNDMLRAATLHRKDSVVVHGDCPEGPDRYAKKYAVYAGLTQEPHPAKWRLHGKGAGFIRNQDMVNLGADICLAFIDHCMKPNCPVKIIHGSHGATHTADAANVAGIPVMRFEVWRLDGNN